MKTLKGHVSVLNAMAISLERELLFTASDDSTVRSWSLKVCISDNRLFSQSSNYFSLSQTLERVMLYVGHSSWVTDVAVEGAVLFTASNDKTARAWEISVRFLTFLFLVLCCLE